MLEVLLNEDKWEKFYEYKTSLIKETSFNKKLRTFIDNRRYIELYELIVNKSLSIPNRSEISKVGTTKKRVIYKYKFDENIMLKFLTWYLLRKYDYCFSDNLYSFRPNINAKTAINRIKKLHINHKYFYKTDIHDYFNSIPTDRLIVMLNDVLKEEDNDIKEFFKYVLKQPLIYNVENKEYGVEQKGIMAGTPFAAFLANVYLSDLDKYFSDNGIIYARYSDDIIVFADTAEDRDNYANFIRNFMISKGLEINPKKDVLGNPETDCVFLGFKIDSENVIDIAPVTVDKLKAKMRRKYRALDRWGNRNKVDREVLAKKFIEIFNHKLFDRPDETELSWSYWYFSVITTDKSLKIIDNYAQDCIRYLAYGHHTKGRFKIRYEQIKEWGYRCLVTEWHKWKNKNQ